MKASEFLIALQQLNRDDLVSIKGIGDVLADNYIEFLESDRYKDLVQGFESLENKGTDVNIITQQAQATSGTLSGEQIVITGSFEIPRDQIKELLEAQGAKVASAITSNTTILIAGEKAGSKLAKAQNLGIKIISDYQSLLKNP